MTVADGTAGSHIERRSARGDLRQIGPHHAPVRCERSAHRGPSAGRGILGTTAAAGCQHATDPDFRLGFIADCRWQAARVERRSASASSEAR